MPPADRPVREENEMDGQSGPPVDVDLHHQEANKETAVTPTIAFKARLNVDTAVTNAGQTIVFPTVIFNEGDAYNPNTGMFTASVSGTYMFSLAFCVYSSRSLVVGIMIEGTKYTTSMFYGDGNHECLSADTVAIVTAGQKIWVQVLPGGNTGTILDQDAMRWNTFAGALINKR
ncbi:complement C1q tumor necrosis factor-related protein 7-like [Ruditapes philippinarum]|uniref:complement C1q tumor necrosis factor-related protein 7-like n=1 Tax=Ruditapes philippinarum TaxID=129788 RepID=UPI00295BD3AD|nr:complement C1q tumor necrosis factor-related protein 7-like [Ruditapes philippinarum]